MTQTYPAKCNQAFLSTADTLLVPCQTYCLLTSSFITVIMYLVTYIMHAGPIGRAV